MEDALDTARSMGLSTLNKETSRYGLSLVLGSGEVTLLDLTSAYGVFANEGVKNPHTGILRIEDVEGEILEEFEEVPEQVLTTETARMITSMLSDNTARTPSFGPNSPLFFPDYDVAAKTGTTNNYLDLWTVGYNPNIAVGIWSGNNDNTAVNGEVAGFVVAPMWQEFMRFALENMDEVGTFRAPQQTDNSNLKPILRGQWQGGYTSNTGLLESRSNQQLMGGIHNILHWVQKANPRGPIPTNPASDGQYTNWEYSVQRWVGGSGFSSVEGEIEYEDSVEVVAGSGFLQIITELSNSYSTNDKVDIGVRNTNDIDLVEVYVDGELLDDDESQPFSLSFSIRNTNLNKGDTGVLLIRGISNDGDVEEVTHYFSITD